ncbi:PREDICTED: ubiquitin-associated domain-containing protein 1 [Dipodomys ordii]|uniref:Ubiquitin-associated domain-containing protein 1 n=1 Tax=Dipodomys ordii TaxID=10020 RepID=A0A1S3G9W4_DIPOR|nr:PREDICTED: ubiquitin-associated domain-containing protein 1 [Dipodomys ordii]
MLRKLAGSLRLTAQLSLQDTGHRVGDLAVTMQRENRGGCHIPHLPAASINKARMDLSRTSLCASTYNFELNMPRAADGLLEGDRESHGYWECLMQEKRCAHGSLEDPKNVTHHKLIHAASERVLNDTKTILEENVQDKDVLLLIKKRAPSPLPKMADVSAEEKKKQEQKAPDKDAILRATANLPACSTDRAAVQTTMRDFQTELRKILVSLIEVAQKLLALNPDAVELFKKANAMLDEDEEERVDEAALRQLTEMGFPESRASKALRLNHSSLWAAVSCAVVLTGYLVPFQAVISLMEMGFDEKEVIDALRVNNNQQNAACEWLLGDRKPSPEELDQGIDPNSPLFQAILDNPVVQLGLTNPKTLLAFEDMLENPLNSTQWMNDPETGPVMLQISRIFQTLNRT